MNEYRALIRCYSFEEAVGIANLYGFATTCEEWPSVLGGNPIFDFRRYEHYAHDDYTFCFAINDEDSIWDYGRYESMRDRCPEEFHFDAADVIAPYLDGDFQSDDLEVLLNG